MVDKWLPTRNRIDHRRSEKSFASYADVLADPHGDISKWIDAVRVIPLSAYEWKCLDDWHVGPRTLNDSFWFCFPNGRGVVELAKPRAKFRFGPKDLIMIPRGVEHAVYLDRGVGTRQLSIHFHADVFGNTNLLDLVGFPYHIPGAGDAGRNTFVSTSERLVRMFAIKAPGWSRVMSAEILTILVEMIWEHAHLFRPPGDQQHGKELARLLPVFQLIEKKFSDDQLTVRRMAQTISVSEVYLRNLFRRGTGISPVAYLQRRRIQHATIQLRSTELSIKQIATQCGMPDLPFFYRVFKNLIGKPPAVYRDSVEV